MLVSILVFGDVEGLSRILGTVLVLALYRYRYTRSTRCGLKLAFCLQAKIPEKVAAFPPGR